MATERIRNIYKRGQDRIRVKTALKKGDLVMVIAGGHGKKRLNVGKTGKIKAFTGKNKDRVIVEGLNFVTRHQKQTGPNKPAGKVPKEASIHISNVMFYAEKIKKAVRLKQNVLSDGKKVRGYTDPKSKEFTQI
jgi:large subunit ribosomal protein L24